MWRESTPCLNTTPDPVAFAPRATSPRPRWPATWSEAGSPQVKYGDEIAEVVDDRRDAGEDGHRARAARPGARTGRGVRRSCSSSAGRGLPRRRLRARSSSRSSPLAPRASWPASSSRPIASREGVPVITAVPTSPRGALLHDKGVVSNLQEVRARGARTIVIAGGDGDTTVEPVGPDVVIRIPQSPTLLQPLLRHPLQVFACEMAKARGHDVDQPRNLPSRSRSSSATRRHRSRRRAFPGVRSSAGPQRSGRTREART